jgi:hypothetical protein
LEEVKKWAAEWNMSVEDVLASQDERFPKVVVAPKPKFVMGRGPLVRIMIVASVPREYYGRHEEIHVEFEELFQMYNCDALDKSLMSCYCL